MLICESFLRIGCPRSGQDSIYLIWSGWRKDLEVHLVYVITAPWYYDLLQTSFLQPESFYLLQCKRVVIWFHHIKLLLKLKTLLFVSSWIYTDITWITRSPRIRWKIYEPPKSFITVCNMIRRNCFKDSMCVCSEFWTSLLMSGLLFKSALLCDIPFLSWNLEIKWLEQ